MKLKYFVLGLLFISKALAGNSLVCSLPEKDFGLIEEGKKFSCTFAIRNVSKKNVNVDKVISSCGCIITSKKEFKLEPNESTDLNVDFTTNGIGGIKIWKTIAVCPNDSNDKPLVLTIKADVKGIPPEKSIVIEPSQKTIDGDPNKVYILRLQIPSDPNIKFSIDTPDWLNHSLQKSKYNNSAVVVNWEIKLNLKSKQRGKLSGNLIVNSNLPRFEKVSIPIQVIQKPKLLINPYMITFDRSESSQSKEVSIKPVDDSLETIGNLLEIKSSREGIETNWTSNSNEIHLKVTNKSSNSEPAKIEIKSGNEILGAIPVIFR